jgi:membrane protein
MQQSQARRAPAVAQDADRGVPNAQDREKPKGLVGMVYSQLEKHTPTRVLLSTVEGFMRDEGQDHAAAMTYYGIFSLFPLILLFLSIGGIVLQNNEWVREQLTGLIVGLLPEGQDALRKVIMEVITQKGAAAGIGLLTLAWSAIGWFQVIDKNVNYVWGVSKPRPFIKGKLFALAMAGGIGLVALAAFGATAAVGVLEKMTGSIPGSAVLWQAVVALVGVLPMGLAFYLLYRYVPQRKVYFADIWPAALITALLWEFTRYALTRSFFCM